MNRAATSLPSPAGISPGRKALRRLAGRPSAWFAFGVIGLFLLIAVCCELHGAICEYRGTVPRYEQEDAAAAGTGPSAEHWLGTDYLGRDVLWRAAAGTVTAFKVGIAGAGIAVLIGVTLGLAAGHFGGWVDGMVVWLYSVFAAMPTLLFVLAFALLLNRGFLPEGFVSALNGAAKCLRTDASSLAVYVAIGLTGWSSMCVVVRAEAMKITRKPFVAAARVAGVGEFRILLRHLLPNVGYLVIIFFTLRFAYAVMTEVIVSFLGVGGRAVPSWGLMIADGQERLWRGDWYEAGAATFGVFLLVLAFQLAGDTLRDALDPKGE